ncbi:MAG: hypothetical protein ACJAZC_002361 [Cryomorphaceae bacterium]|jgi:hypothetical protein
MGKKLGVKSRFYQDLFPHSGFARLVVVLEELSVLLELKVYLLKEGVFFLFLFFVMVARLAMGIAKELIHPAFYFLVAGQTGMWF